MFEEESRKRKSMGARYGHVKRQLKNNQPLKGKVLRLAIDVVGEDSEIGEKLKAGEPLSEYELHLMIDVYLLHARLAG